MLIEGGFGEEDAMFEPNLQRKINVSQTNAEEPRRKKGIPLCKSTRPEERFNMGCVELHRLVLLEPLYSL